MTMLRGMLLPSLPGEFFRVRGMAQKGADEQAAKRSFWWIPSCDHVITSLVCGVSSRITIHLRPHVTNTTIYMIGSIGSHVTHGARLKVSLLRTSSSNNII
jgi:hypothetical protein